MINTWYETFTNSAGNLLVWVKAHARYSGSVDVNDDFASISTELNASNFGSCLTCWDPAHIEGFGQTYSEPFATNMSIWCTSGACANTDLPRQPCEGSSRAFDVKYKGRGWVVIPHGSFDETSILQAGLKTVPCDPDVDPCPQGPQAATISMERYQLGFDGLDPLGLGPALPTTHRQKVLDGVRYLMDEWEVKVTEGSQGLGRSVAVTIDAPVHPASHRWVGRPTVEIEAEHGRIGLPDARHVARIEFLENGSVAEVLLLGSDRDLSPADIGLISERLRTSVSIMHKGSQSHYAVAYASLKSSAQGLELDKQIVVLPRCFCWPE